MSLSGWMWKSPLSSRCEPVPSKRIGRSDGWRVAAVIGLLFAPMVGAMEGDPVRGRGYYAQWCSPCHGHTGKGDGPMAHALNPRPRDHTDDKLMSALPDQTVFEIIQGGGIVARKSPFMPSFGTVGNPYGIALNDQQIWDLVAYVRTLHRSVP